MAWSRRFFDQWEWYHKPVSPMEASLLLPKHVDQILKMLSKRFCLKLPPAEKIWKVQEGYLYLTDRYTGVLLHPQIIIFPFRFLHQMPNAKNKWTNITIPEYQSKIDGIKKINFKKLTTSELTTEIEKTCLIESNLLAESLYTITFAVFSEICLKNAYKIFVSDKNPDNYHELLIGFPDRGIESDIELWQIAQEKDKNKQNLNLKDWVSRFGYRIQDKDILYPTLGESSETIKSYLNLFKSSPNPSERVKKAIEKRSVREVYVKNHIFPLFSGIFQKIMLNAQEYAKIRNSRPFYYQGNEIIRKMLLELAKRTGLKDNEVFFLTFEELKEGLLGNKAGMENKIYQRQSLYNKYSESEPELTKNE